MKKAILFFIEKRAVKKLGAIGLVLALVLEPSGLAWAQTHKVAAKPETVVRAVGVYEWTGDLAKPTGIRFVPVTIFIDGELKDAGLYKPQPVPFALLTGNIYELEDAGLAKGNVTLESALHAVTTDGAAGPPFVDGWTAYGIYKAPSAPKKSAPLKASKNLPVIAISGGDASKPHLADKSDSASSGKPADSSQSSQTSPQTSPSAKTDSSGDSDPDRPTMHRRTADSTASNGDATSAGTTNKPSDTSKTSDTSSKPSDSSTKTDTSTASTDDDPDHPTLHRRSVDASATDDSGSTTSSNDDAERPTLKRSSTQDTKKKKSQKELASVTGGGSLNDDPDRPRLHHGGGSKEDNEAPKLMGVPRDMRQMVAVSDAKDRDPHVFARPWEDMNERAAILAKMQAFARAKLAEYGVVPGVTPPNAVTGAPSTTPAAKTATVNPNNAPDSGPPALKRGAPSKSQLAAESNAAAAGTGSATASTATTAASTASTATTANQDQGPPTLKRGIPAKSSSTAAGTAASTTAGKKTTAPSRAKTHKGAAPAPVTLADEDLRGYTLSYGGSPTYVYMAHTVETGSVMRYVTIVAQDNGMGELKVALGSATDAAHLDRTPWMRLIDVVDAEASNRASLLFEMRGQSSRQFSLYRVIAARPEQIFPNGS